MRVLYLLFLLPLGAWAGCPSGIQLSNVPIATPLPYCVKWESSTLGGCAVDCKGVCVEILAAGTKGPMQTTGAECELGGGDPGGGDTGGSDNSGDVGANGPLHLARNLWLGSNSTADISSGFNAVSKNIERFKNSFEATAREQRTDFSFVAKDIAQIAKNTAMSSSAVNYGPLLYEMNSHLKSLNDKSVLEPGFWNNKHFETTGQLSDLRQDISSLGGELQTIGNILKAGGGSSGGGNSGGGGVNPDDVSAIRGDVASLKAMTESAMMPYFSNISSKSNQMESYLRQVPGKLSTISEQMNGQNSMLSGYLDPMNSNLYEMKALLRDIRNSSNGSGSGTGDGSGAAEIDYSKMPGTEGNPIHVAGSKYSSRVCLDGMNCAFDLAAVNKEYSDAKEEMARRYDEIKKEVSETFKFELNGSASTPKCFDMFSLFGKSYSVCPDSGEYWNTLAAILMFIFYFIALMIVARR